MTALSVFCPASIRVTGKKISTAKIVAHAMRFQVGSHMAQQNSVKASNSVNSGAVQASARPAEARTRLYINDGRGRFTDQTDAWKLPSTGYGMGVAAGDFDNDGWTDLFLTSYRGDDTLLRNTGSGFEECGTPPSVSGCAVKNTKQ